MMAIADKKTEPSDGKVWSLCRMPFWQSGGGGGGGGAGSSSSSSSSSSVGHHRPSQGQASQVDGSGGHHQSSGGHHQSSGGHHHSSGSGSVSSVARSLLPSRRRLRLDPANKLYFPYEPGKQAKSAVRIKNISKSHVAFKFQTTSPKSCFMRPPGAILSPGESIIATVFKFVEQPENNEKIIDQKSNVKFKIVSLKVKGPMEYVPELFDELKDQAAAEQILKVIFLDPERPCPQLEKLKHQLAEAEAALETRKKPAEDTGPKIVGEGLVIDEWKERRERYLARQQVEAVDSV
ncbi:vesicle-associated protein 4-2-like [Phoenix dactylifera]|uniref:Vesicle-associated protein 4-2-like n=1 Tax=Phoenix dactylifera TaxID=42345 RepID=A0A8B7D4G9_PHODC|nr:vesicle-associated protein 4-2-like [Phoenix dactylifera]